jgi:hypothetical protein
MLKTSQFALVVLSAVAFGHSTAFADPVTKADLAGKKICWSDETATYGKNGSYDSNLCGHGTWRLKGDQLEEKGDHCTPTGTITKQNGTFHASMNIGASGMYESWGKYCN